MTSGDILTWVLFVIIMAAFYIGLKHIYRNFVSGESDCCKGGGTCPACAECAKEETTAQERKNAANAWKAIRAEAKQKKYACPACEARAKAAEARAKAKGAAGEAGGEEPHYACPACRARAEKMKQQNH